MGDLKARKADRNANAQRLKLEPEAHRRNEGQNDVMNQRLPLDYNLMIRMDWSQV